MFSLVSTELDITLFPFYSEFCNIRRRKGKNFIYSDGEFTSALLQYKSSGKSSLSLSVILFIHRVVYHF